MIEPKQISVIVQGPILGEPWRQREYRLTARVLENLRRVLPGATLIVSTWKGANPTGLDHDVLVESEDPGGLPLQVVNGKQVLANNVNRQIVSTLAGLRAVKTPFAMKLRSDLLLGDLSFLEFFDRFPARDQAFSFTKSRVINSAFHTRVGPNRSRFRPCLFHPSDWFFFGRTEDLIDIWDLPHMTAEEGRWFEFRPKPKGVYDPSGHIARMMPEPYFWSHFVAKHMPLNYDSYLEQSPELCRVSEQTIVNNLILLDPHQLKLKSLKYPEIEWRMGWGNFRGRFSFALWRKLYREYCDPAAAVAWVDLAGFAFIGRFLRGSFRYSLRKLRRLAVKAFRDWLDVDVE